MPRSDVAATMPHVRDDASDAPADLARRFRDYEQQLRRASTELIPAEETDLLERTGAKGTVKRRVSGIVRPATRRYDRIAADLAAQAALLADEAARLAERLAAAEVRIGTLERALGEARAAGAAPAWEQTPEGVSDRYYWAFEAEMRGSVGSIVDRLRQYEDRAVGLLEEAGREPAPIWVDLGCGNGEFMGLLRGWGWHVAGVDTSPRAVQACVDAGLEAAVGDALAYLDATGDAPDGDKPLAVSAIQLIEHLPKDRWLWFFRASHRALRPGGALLVETINPLNPRALADSFFADVSHTWPAHPQALRIMAEQAGFAGAEIVYLNQDHAGGAADFAIWARTATPLTELTPEG